MLTRVRPVLAYLGLACLAAAALLYLMRNELAWYVWTLLALAVVFLGAFGYTSQEEVVDVARGRTVRYGSNAAVMSIAFIGILVLANVLGNRYNQRIDLTANKQFTLAEQTVKILQTLPAPVKVTGFVVGGDPSRQEAESLLREYQARSGQLSYEFVDPQVQPGVAEQMKIQVAPTFIFQMGDKRVDSTAGVSEEEFTSTLIKLTKTEKLRVGFLTGHGERDINDSSDRGYSLLKSALEAQNDDVQPINLTTTPTATQQIDVLVIAAPRTALGEAEKQAIKTYLEQGGKALILRDPRQSADINDLVAGWGLTFGDAVVIDPQSALSQDPSAFVAQRYEPHTITKDLQAFSILPGVSSVIPAPTGTPAPIPNLTELIKTTDRAWGETDPQVAKYDEGKDEKGPVTIAAAVEKPVGEAGAAPDANAKKTRIVAIGDSDFASNSLLTAYADRDLALNSVNWLAEQENLISITPKAPDQRTLFLTDAQSRFILISSVVLLPALVLIIGARIWWERR